LLSYVSAQFDITLRLYVTVTAVLSWC